MQHNIIDTKKELYRELERYRGILNNYIIEYLKSLIELDFSVLREYITNDDRMSLSELEIYKKIFIYNINNRTIEVLNNNNIQFNINKINLNKLTIKNDIKIFEYDYKKAFTSNTSFGTINLFKIVPNEEIVKKELNRVLKKLEELYDAKNPYNNPEGIYEGTSYIWKQNHNKEISYYETLFTELDSNNEKYTKEQIQLLNYLNRLLLNDFGLSNKMFYDEPKSFNNNTSYLTKKRTKKLLNVDIINNIEYI